MRRTTTTWANVATTIVVGVVVTVAVGLRVPDRSVPVDTVEAEIALAFDPVTGAASHTPSPSVAAPAEPRASGSPPWYGAGRSQPEDFHAPATPDLGHPDPMEPTAPWATNALRFIYFVEADEEMDPAAVELIEEQSIRLQQYWFDQFGGTFRLPADGVEVIHGQHDAAWYDTTLNGDDPRWYRLMNLRAEVRTVLGIDADDSTTRLVVYPSARIDGRVGANHYGAAWMDGDDITCVSGAVPSTPYTADFPANCLATVAHELGHVYGLDHTGDDIDCMQLGFYHYVNGPGMCAFSEENRRTVTDDPLNADWLDAVPGDRS